MPVPLALAGLVLIICARWMPVRTAKGTDLARKLLGFRRYIMTMAPGQAHPAGQAPTSGPADAPAGQDALDAYLPYAIVFGCTKEWAEVTAAVADADRAPSWYRTSQPFSPGSLSAGLTRSTYYFSSVHYFAVTANHWVTTNSSGHGGGFLGSGFSGGFSGGGGGGGGGGSW